MRHVVKFPIRNSYRLLDKWPVFVGGRSFFIETAGDKATFIGCSMSGQPISNAPRFREPSQNEIGPTIHIPSGMRLFVERDLRVWQSLTSTFMLFDIDFDHPTELFFPENGEDKDQIPISSWSQGPSDKEITIQDYSVIGRAFVAIDDNYEIVEEISFLIEADRALRGLRIIDAYNYFYLFLESNFKLKSNNLIAAKTLSTNDDFVSAVNEHIDFCNDPYVSNSSSFLNLDNWETDKLLLCKEIVELRGHLRHHSLNNQNRWNLENQEKYIHRAVTLGSICRNIARHKTFDVTWRDKYINMFIDASKKIKATMDIKVILTIKDSEIPREVGLSMNFPGNIPNAALAKAVMEKSLSEFDLRSPGAILFAIRAYIGDTNHELLRYDLGPRIMR